jgi:hypothetical protein
VGVEMMESGDAQKYRWDAWSCVDGYHRGRRDNAIGRRKNIVATHGHVSTEIIGRRDDGIGQRKNMVATHGDVLMNIIGRLK